MSKNNFTSLGESLLHMQGKSSYEGKEDLSSRLIHPAIVRSIEDYGGHNRIKAEIVTIDEKGNIIPSRDRNISTDKLPICIPIMPENLHVRPQVGECVLLMSENPNDLTSVRYWIGPLINSQFKLPYQSFQEAFGIYNMSTFGKQETNNLSLKNKDLKLSSVLPQQHEIAIQGRHDSDIVFKKREIIIGVGKFKSDINEINIDLPCRIQLKDISKPVSVSTGIRAFDNKQNENLKPFTQVNIEATNINLIATGGKNRKFDNNNVEFNSNVDLKSFGETAQKLHPLVFGDELIDLLKLILKYLITHSHTPQSPAITTALTEQLLPYINGNKLQDLISYNVRTN